MIYSNPEFFILFIATAGLFFCGTTQNFRLNLLIIASLVFYAWSGFFHTVIFAAVVVISWLAVFFATLYPGKRNFFLSCGITVMAFHLFFWKYASWATDNVQALFPNFLGGRLVRLPLPVGISFFTLQGIAYLVDVRKGQAKIMGFKKYLLFKSFFAQLVAGPIVRVHQLLPQLDELSTPSSSEVVYGLSLFILGFLKKVVVADRMGALIDPVFSKPFSYNRESLILGVIGYSVQIWADFSGYTDMGRGAARILGIKLPENFLSPYLSKTPTEYWRRWHITLSEWIRDYIYRPMTQAWNNSQRSKILLLVAMFISGLWHGAAWTFALWGLYHGLLLLIQHSLKTTRLNQKFHELPKWLVNSILIVLMYVLTLFGWLIFRAQHWSTLNLYLKCLFHPVAKQRIEDSATLYSGLIFCFLIQTLTYCRLEDRTWIFVKPLAEAMTRFCSKVSLKVAPNLGYRLAETGVAVALGLGFTACLFFRYMGKSNPFIYFQF